MLITQCAKVKISVLGSFSRKVYFPETELFPVILYVV